MIIRKAYKVRLKTNADLEDKFWQYAGHCRFIWNYFWRLNKYRLDQGLPIMRYGEMDYFLKLLKSSDEYSFLKEAPSHCLQQKLKDLDKAYRDGFDKKQSRKWLPKKRKKQLHSSFRFPDSKQFEIDNRRMKLPKLGWVSFYKSQPILGAIKNITLSYQAGHWYASIQVEQEIQTHAIKSSSIIGLDMGISSFVTTSQGEHISPINAFRKLAARLKRLQRRLSKKKKFSQNWRKIKTKIQHLHQKIGHIRRDFLHKTSTMLSKNHASIVVEALKVVNMSKSSKGTLEAPGKCVKAKSGLNKSILDQGWGEFKHQLGYKLNWHGGMLVEVPAHYTSQQCSVCGHITKENRTNQAKFECVSCGHKAHADVNAAKNILAAGHAVLACGEKALVISMKKEPQGMRKLIPA